MFFKRKKAKRVPLSHDVGACVTSTHPLWPAPHRHPRSRPGHTGDFQPWSWDLKLTLFNLRPLSTCSNNLNFEWYSKISVLAVTGNPAEAEAHVDPGGYQQVSVIIVSSSKCIFYTSSNFIKNNFSFQQSSRLSKSQNWISLAKMPTSEPVTGVGQECSAVIGLIWGICPSLKSAPPKTHELTLADMLYLPQEKLGCGYQKDGKWMMSRP